MLNIVYEKVGFQKEVAKIQKQGIMEQAFFPHRSIWALVVSFIGHFELLKDWRRSVSF
jgi:hypothetical protein